MTPNEKYKQQQFMLNLETAYSLQSFITKADASGSLTKTDRNHAEKTLSLIKKAITDELRKNATDDTEKKGVKRLPYAPDVEYQCSGEVVWVKNYMTRHITTEPFCITDDTALYKITHINTDSDKNYPIFSMSFFVEDMLKETLGMKGSTGQRAKISLMKQKLKEMHALLDKELSIIDDVTEEEKLTPQDRTVIKQKILSQLMNGVKYFMKLFKYYANCMHDIKWYNKDEITERWTSSVEAVIRPSRILRPEERDKKKIYRLNENPKWQPIGEFNTPKPQIPYLDRKNLEECCNVYRTVATEKKDTKQTALFHTAVTYDKTYSIANMAPFITDAKNLKRYSMLGAMAAISEEKTQKAGSYAWLKKDTTQTYVFACDIQHECDRNKWLDAVRHMEKWTDILEQTLLSIPDENVQDFIKRHKLI